MPPALGGRGLLEGLYMNYIKIAWRNLWKGKVYNAMNIIGLSVAIACAILLFLTVHYEFSFDRFHNNLPNIYQLYFTSNRANGVEYKTTMPVPLAPAVKSDYQDIKYYTRSANTGASVRYGEKEIGQDIHFVDEGFLKMFTFPVIKGASVSPMHQLNDVVITEYSAKAIFGKDDPIGKPISINLTGTPQSFIVRAVVKDFPENSSIKFDMLLRFENYPNYQSGLNSWDNFNHLVFVELNDQTAIASFNKRLQAFVNKHFKQDVDNIKRDGAAPDANGQVFTLKTSPFADVHFNTILNSEGAPVSKSYVLSLLAIGIFILVIACINFINLSVARSFTRAREVGVRKTLGASKWQLLIQFWTETVLICLSSLIAGVLLAMLVLPGFKAAFRSHIDFGMLLQPSQLFAAAGIFILVTFIAGFYPALLMLRYKTVLVLKGTVNTAKPGKVRNILLGVQFAISTLLILCTLITWKQIDYIQNRPLGYNKTEVISIPLGKITDGAKALNLFRNQLNGQPDIIAMTGAYDNLGRGADGGTRTSLSSFNYNGREVRTAVQKVDYDFLKTLDIKLIDGRDFSRAYATDSNAIVINETMAKLITQKKATGIMLPMEDKYKSEIIGVVKDYNFRPLRDPVMALTLVMDKNYPINYIFIKVKAGSLSQSFDLISKKWHETFPDVDFKGTWLNENTEKQYAKEQRLSKIFISSSITAILISCIGLIAISIMIMIQRTKEIGIRKVLGASIAGIVLLLSRDFMKLVLIAAVISFPIAWYVMENWLQGFAYRISIEWWIFAVAASISVVIAFITISFQSIRAAIANPVNSLKSE